MQFLLPRHLAIFSKPILFIALLGVVSASIERSNLRGNDRALISISPSTNDELATNDLIDNKLTTNVSNNCNDDTTFMFWDFADNDCEMVRATVNNQTYHDENGDFLRINCMKANSNRGSYCPSCAMTGVFEKCPTVCEPLRCSQAPVDGVAGGAVCCHPGGTEDHDTWYRSSTRTCKCNNGEWIECYDNLGVITSEGNDIHHSESEEEEEEWVCPTPVPTASPTNPPTTTSPSSPPTQFCYDHEGCEWVAEDLTRCDFPVGNPMDEQFLFDFCRVTCVPECRHSESENDDPRFNWWGMDGQGCKWIREQFINPAYLDERKYSLSKCLGENLNNARMCPSCELLDISTYCPLMCA